MSADGPGRGAVTCSSAAEVLACMERGDDILLAPTLTVLDLSHRLVDWHQLGEALYRPNKLRTLNISSCQLDEWAYHEMEHGLRGATDLFELICRDNPLTPPALETLVIAVKSMKVQLLDCTGTAGVEWPWKRILRNGRVEFIRNVPARSAKTPAA